nr:MAG TPA: hypothetical protein [Caudoviricetes sp.]
MSQLQEHKVLNHLLNSNLLQEEPTKYYNCHLGLR